MRTAAKQLTPDEMHALAAFYGTRAGTQSVTEVGSP
jgi:hypothetical protein